MPQKSFLCIELVRALTDSEVSKFRFVTEQNLNSEQQKLFEMMVGYREKSDNPAREDLYEAGFGTKWSEKKDYLLRNALRHIAKEIKIFLELSMHENRLRTGEATPGVAYLQALTRRLSPEWVEKEYRAALKKAENDIFPDEAYNLTVFFQDYFTRSAQQNKSNLEKVLPFPELALFHARRDYLLKVRHQESMLAFNELAFWLQESDTQFTPPSTLPWIAEQPELDTPYLRYLDLKADSYRLTGVEKTAVLEELLELLEQFSPRRVSKNTERARIQNNLALEYMHLGNWDKSIHYFAEAMAPKNKLPARTRHVIAFNRVSVQLRAGAYADVLAQFEKLEWALKKNPQLVNRMECMRIIALIRLEQYDEAYSRIPDLMIDCTPHNYYYLRTCMAIIYYARSDWDMAERENTNIIQSLRQKDIMISLFHAARFFNRLITLQSGLETQARQAALLRLKDETSSYFDSVLEPSALTQPALWIYDAIMAAE